MTKSRLIIRIFTRALLIAGAALLLNMPADAGDASRTRRSGAKRVAPRTQVTGQVGTRVRTVRTGRSYRPYRHGFGYGYGSYYRPWNYGFGVSVWPRVHVHGDYGYPVYYRGPRASASARIRYGALDLDVRPRTTEIYIDGEYVGLARSFDGWPDVLWLEPGSYDVSFYRDGYETVTRRFKVTDDAVMDVRERLRKGESVRPEPVVRAAEVPAKAAITEQDAAATPKEQDAAPGVVLTYPRRSAGEDR